VIAYDLKGAAEVVPFSEDHLRREIHAGRLKAKHPGRKYVITTEALAAWVAAFPDAD
jgi:excisionase family DNA binding protein